MPALLFSQGVMATDHRAVAVVGTREASEDGKRVAANVAATLANTGITVVSGLAKGIDTAAHEAALRAKGRTVAVIGTGIDRYYPAENRPLQQRIAAEGLVLSQFRPGSAPTRYSFPMRNAVMSGYAAATVVIEAAYRSGARMQARLALEHGRAVILRSELLEHDWARSYAQRPGVYVVSGTTELLGAINDIVAGIPLSQASLEELPDFAVA
jgi:DNA processing protein